jgi:hypothetical protein
MPDTANSERVTSLKLCVTLPVATAIKPLHTIASYNTRLNTFIKPLYNFISSTYMLQRYDPNTKGGVTFKSKLPVIMTCSKQKSRKEKTEDEMTNDLLDKMQYCESCENDQ